jgi:hypothetical protein
MVQVVTVRLDQELKVVLSLALVLCAIIPKPANIAIRLSGNPVATIALGVKTLRISADVVGLSICLFANVNQVLLVGWVLNDVRCIPPLVTGAGQQILNLIRTLPCLYGTVEA